MSAYSDWLLTLDGRQIRALACQAGVKDWKTRQVDKLAHSLPKNKRARGIWVENYGKKTGIKTSGQDS